MCYSAMSGRREETKKERERRKDGEKKKKRASSSKSQPNEDLADQMLLQQMEEMCSNMKGDKLAMAMREAKVPGVVKGEEATDEACDPSTT